MKRQIVFPLSQNDPSQGFITVEVDDTADIEERETSTYAGRPGTENEEEPPKKEEAPKTFAEALSTIRPATETLVKSLSGLVHKPTTVDMEFGFIMNAKAGVVIASVSTEANYKVTLHWEDPGKPQ